VKTRAESEEEATRRMDFKKRFREETEEIEVTGLAFLSEVTFFTFLVPHVFFVTFDCDTD
jgi:hypothetical protein